ncbi:MAG: ABC transporter permease subunit [Treponema sp.]
MILGIFSSAAALFLIAIGALYSEYAGRLALFLDAVINLSAFLFFAFAFSTGNAVFAFCLAVFVSSALIYGLALTVERLKADPFVAAIALSLIIEGAVSALSAGIFGTRGVLTAENFAFPRAQARLTAGTACVVLSALLIIFLKTSVKGLYFRISGTDPDVLEARGVNSSAYKCRAWLVTAFCASAAGGFYAAEISSFVPNIAGGRGWIALALVFLGRKKPLFIAAAAIFFAAAEYASSYLPNALPAIPSALLISLPYIAALAVISALPRERTGTTGE